MISSPSPRRTLSPLFFSLSVLGSRSRSPLCISYFKNFKGLNVKLFPGLFGIPCPVDVVKKVNSVSIWIFSTFGAWYPLRFPASVLFSWVCMFRCFCSLLSAVAFSPRRRRWIVLVFSSEQCSVNSAVPRSPLCFFRHGGLLLYYNFLLHHQLPSSYFHEVHSSLFVQVNSCFLVIKIRLFN